MSKIKNFYEIIPKEFLLNAENPNFDLHKLKLPFRLCICAPSGSGKTVYLINLLALFCERKGTFANITIITRNKDEPLYKWLETKSDSISIKEGLHNAPVLDKMNKEENSIVIYDDLVLSKDMSSVEAYYIRARKLNCSVIFLSQSYFRIPKIIRGNCNYLVLLKLSGDRDLNLIMNEFGMGVTKETIMKMYLYCTKEKFNVMLIDLEAEPSQRFRHNILDILNPADFA